MGKVWLITYRVPQLSMRHASEDFMSQGLLLIVWNVGVDRAECHN